MAIGEFSLIKKYFSTFDQGTNIVLGIGDDCALVDVKENHHLAITTDTLNEGIHFFKDLDPYLIGYRALIVNLSDLSAMGAKPAFFTLSLTLENSNENFLAPFAQGLLHCAQKYNIKLIGGNTSKGPLSITISAYGMVKKDCALRRDGAIAGDDIYVTGSLGLPGFYVDVGYKKFSVDKKLFSILEQESNLKRCYCDFMYDLAIHKLSSCAIDISDGLYGDLGHIVNQSHCGAQLYLERLPLHHLLNSIPSLSTKERLDYALFGGCDYETLFTANPKYKEEIFCKAREYQISICKIGKIVDYTNDPIECTFYHSPYFVDKKPFEHF